MDRTLTVVALADIFPLVGALVVVPAPTAVAHHLTTVLPRLLAPVIRLARIPEAGSKVYQSPSCIHAYVNKIYIYIFLLKPLL